MTWLDAALKPSPIPYCFSCFRRKLVIRLTEIGPLLVLQDTTLLFRVTRPEGERQRHKTGEKCQLPDRVQHTVPKILAIASGLEATGATVVPSPPPSRIAGKPGYPVFLANPI